MSNGSWSAIFLRNKYCPRIFELSVVAEIDFVFRRQEAVGKTREEQPVYSTCRTQGGAARRASCHVDSRPGTIQPLCSSPTDPNTDPGLSQNGASGKDGPGRAPTRKDPSPPHH